MSVKVAVRVRPFNDIEREVKSVLCVDMKKNTTIVTKSDGKTRPFTFDYSFWSHDGYEEKEDGYLSAVSDRYADQQEVYEAVGKEVLDNAWGGYHCCLFAYGQTGSGKSYSMIGYGANRGIVPIAANEIFQRIKANSDDKKEFEVSISMLEIYNEKIQDLLTPVEKRKRGGLKVRQKKKLGIYVEGLSKWPVDSYEGIQEKMSLGNENRTIGATDMNATSSRAHTIITINFKQKELVSGKKVEKLSVINLVDLAGSEKASKTNATGDRLKEGCAINQSLSSLSMVISILAEKAMGKAKKKIVPYRSSALTRILQNALGGNSKTIMICAISPSSYNYDETVSTLRYADQAKKIKCKAVVNESETDKMIRELKQENEKLKMMFSKLHAGDMPQELGALMDQMNAGGDGKGVIKEGGEGNLSKASTQGTNGSNSQVTKIAEEQTDALKKKLLETEEMYAANLMMLEEYEKTFKQRLLESEMRAPKKEKFDYSTPHISNINEDPILTGKVVHGFKDRSEVRVGRKNTEPKNQIIISTIGIQKHHAVFIQDEDGVFIEPVTPECADYIHLNGEIVSERKRLFHLDRVVFGIGSAFIFKDEENADFKRTDVGERDIDLEFCQKEIIKVDQMDFIVNKVEEEATQKKLEKQGKMLEEYQEKIQQAKIRMENAEMEQQRKIREQEFKEMEMEFEMKKIQRDFELEKHKQEILENEQKRMNKEKERRILEEKLAKYVPLITEVNLIARELKRDINIMPHLAYYFAEKHDVNENDQLKRLRIKVKVENYEAGYTYIWDLNRFQNRYYMIKEELDTYFETNEFPKPSREEDPFWDPPEPQIIGQGFLKLLSIAYLLDNPTELVLVGDNGQIGVLRVNLLPADDLGNPIDPDALLDEEMIEDPRELLERRLDFVLQIEGGELPEEFCANTFCKYSIRYGDKVETFDTNILEGNHQFPIYNYSRHHFFEKVDEKVLSYLLNANLCIEVFGNDNKEDLISSEEEEVPEEEPEVKVTKLSEQEILRRKQQKVLQEQERKLIEQEKEMMKRMGYVDNHNAKAKKSMRKRGKNKKDKDCTLI